MTALFGFFGLGLRSLHAAQAGIQIAGTNISNINTPGYARRRLDLQTGLPIQMTGGSRLDSGVEIAGIRRQENIFIQRGLERERGILGQSQELFRGLSDIEQHFGELEGDTLSAAYVDFAARFSELAARPEDLSQRRSAIASAAGLAARINSIYDHLRGQRTTEDEAVRVKLTEVNRLAEDLANLNDQLAITETGGGEAHTLRDRQSGILDRLVDLTGGQVHEAEGGRLYFTLRSGHTLVAGGKAREITLAKNADGVRELSIGGSQVTASFREGEVGALLALRDDHIPERLQALDQLAADLIRRTNGLLAGGQDLQGNAGNRLFEPDPPPATGAAGLIAVSSAVRDDPGSLALSASGSPGDGSIAQLISQLRITSSATLGDRTPDHFLADLASDLGGEVTQAGVSADVSRGVVDNLEARRASTSGVSLDDEALDLVRYQRAYEAAARFIAVLSEISEITVNVGR